MGLMYSSSPYFLSAQSSSKELGFTDEGRKFSVSVYGTYVSSAELLDNIESPIPFLRDASVELVGGYGYGAELTYDPQIYDLGITAYISSEYLKVTDDGLVMRFTNDSHSVEIGFTEEYSLIPVEAGLKWNLPVSTNSFKIYIGGGAGIYFGNRKRSFGTLSSSTLSTSPGFSLNVLSGMQYYIGRNLSLNFEFKFREGSFDTRDSFGQNSITIDGQNYELDNPAVSRIIVDGVRLSLGVRYNF